MSRCVICGKTSLFGGETTADGKICRHCLDKISDHLNGIRALPARKLRAHVAYREENMRLYGIFNPTSVTGQYDCLHVDTKNKLFAVSTETSSLKYKPDIFRFEDLLGYCLDIKDENGSTTTYGERLRPEVYKHRATCRFTPPPELPTVRNGETIPPELRYLNDGEKDTHISVYLYLNNPWIPFIRMFMTKRPTGCYGTRSYNRAVETARGVISHLKEILSATGQLATHSPVSANPTNGTFRGPNPVFRVPPAPAFAPSRGGYGPNVYSAPSAPLAFNSPKTNSALSNVAPYIATAAHKPIKCPVCGAVGQTGRECEYCGTKLR